MNSKKLLSNLTFLIIVSLISSCTNYPKKDKELSPIVGSWRVNSIHWVTKDTTYSIEKAQPGMLLITPNRYSIMWTPIEEPRTAFQNLSEPTDEELKSGFRSIVFNCGTYEFSDSTLTTTAEIAKVPGFEGGKQFYSYKLEQNRMELIMFDELYPDGSRPKWYGKYKTKFILNKIE